MKYTVFEARPTSARPGEFIVESDAPVRGALWPDASTRRMSVGRRELAVVIAAKSQPLGGGEIRVVHAPSGEVVFRKPAQRPSAR